MSWPNESELNSINSLSANKQQHQVWWMDEWTDELTDKATTIVTF